MNGLICNNSSFSFRKEQRHVVGSNFKYFKRYRTFDRDKSVMFGRPSSIYGRIAHNPNREKRKYLKFFCGPSRSITTILQARIGETAVAKHQEVVYAVKKKFEFDNLSK